MRFSVLMMVCALMSAGALADELPTCVDVAAAHAVDGLVSASRSDEGWGEPPCLAYEFYNYNTSVMDVRTPDGIQSCEVEVGDYTYTCREDH